MVADNISLICIEHEHIDASIMIIKVEYNGQYLWGNSDILFEYKIPYNYNLIKTTIPNERIYDFQCGVRLTSEGNFIICNSELVCY